MRRHSTSNWLRPRLLPPKRKLAGALRLHQAKGFSYPFFQPTSSRQYLALLPASSGQAYEPYCATKNSLVGSSGYAFACSWQIGKLQRVRWRIMDSASYRWHECCLGSMKWVNTAADKTCWPIYGCISAQRARAYRYLYAILIAGRQHSTKMHIMLFTPQHCTTCHWRRRLNRGRNLYTFQKVKLYNGFGEFLCTREKIKTGAINTLETFTPTTVHLFTSAHIKPCWIWGMTKIQAV